MTDMQNHTKPLRRVQLEHVERVLLACGWNVTRAAKALGIDRRTLYRKIKLYGFIRPADRVSHD